MPYRESSRRARMMVALVTVASVAILVPGTASAGGDPAGEKCESVQRSMRIPSDAETMVVVGNDGAPVPHPAVLAWEPWGGGDPSVWDNNVDYAFVEADWIWEAERVVSPVNGDIVEFEREFAIPGRPVSGTLSITVDNGYEVSLNGAFVGTDNLFGDWRAGDLTQPFVDGSPDPDLWQTVEHYDVSEDLVRGANTLAITGVNEFMDPSDEFNVDVGNIDNNPAGLIYELEVTYRTKQDCKPPRPGPKEPVDPKKP